MVASGAGHLEPELSTPRRQKTLNRIQGKWEDFQASLVHGLRERLSVCSLVDLKTGVGSAAHELLRSNGIHYNRSKHWSQDLVSRLARQRFTAVVRIQKGQSLKYQKINNLGLPPWAMYIQTQEAKLQVHSKFCFSGFALRSGLTLNLQSSSLSLPSAVITDYDWLLVDSNKCEKM